MGLYDEWPGDAMAVPADQEVGSSFSTVTFHSPAPPPLLLSCLSNPILAFVEMLNRSRPANMGDPVDGPTDLITVCLLGWSASLLLIQAWA